MAFEMLSQYLDTLETLGIPDFKVIVKKDHQTLFSEKRGQHAEKRFFLYSCSKVLTVTAAMQLVEKGVLSLDAPVSRYLPAFGNAYLMEDGKKRPPRTQMTLRHLFTMSAGLDYDFRKAPVMAARKDPKATTVSVAESFVADPLCFDPGDRFQYSLCHDVLGAMIEKVTGMTFAAYMEQHIFRPLGMKDTSFLFEEKEMAPQFQFDSLTRTYAKIPTECEYMLCDNYYSGGAGIVSTAEDLALFTDALACGGTGSSGAFLLKPETIDLIRTEQLTALVKDPAFGCSAGPGYGYALGVRTLIDRSQGQKSPLGEFGWDGAAGCYEMIDPENHLSIAFVMQVKGWNPINSFLHAPIRDAVYTELNL